MKKYLLHIIVAILFLGIGYYAAPDILGGRSASYNPYGSDSQMDGNSTLSSATTTLNTNAVKIIDSNEDRQYAKICNNSDIELFLGLENHDSVASATESVLINQGISIAANGTYNDCFEINLNNLYTGDIWVASTTADKSIIFTEI